MGNLEESICQYNMLRKDLLQVVRCLDKCTRQEKGMYQEIALCYSYQIKNLQRLLKEQYQIKFCHGVGEL